jgi:hypothetical protein
MKRAKWSEGVVNCFNGQEVHEVGGSIEALDLVAAWKGGLE